MPPASITFDFARSVFYPASGTDGAPIKYFSKWFQSFLYADLGMTRETFEKIAAWESMLLHYRRSSIAWLDPETVFGCRMEQTVFCCHLHFARVPRAPKDKDLPATLELLFTNCEGVQALAAYRIRKTYPAAATYIRVGLALGGNYETFREEYAAALTFLGPVPHLIIDEEGLDEKRAISSITAASIPPSSTKPMNSTPKAAMAPGESASMHESDSADQRCAPQAFTNLQTIITNAYYHIQCRPR